MTTDEKKQQALTRATCGRSWANYPAIIEGFIEKGIPADDIQPRENVLTFWAWKAVGRRVRKGEHGVKVLTWVPMEGKKTDAEQQPHDGAEQQPRSKSATRPRTTTVFHVSQTEPDPHFKPDRAA